MGQNHSYISFGLFLFLLQSPPVKSDIQKTAISDCVDLNMNTSLIAGQDGYCVCHIGFESSAELVLSVHNLTSPHCATSVSLSGYDLNTTCIDGYIQHQVYNISFANGSGLWIVVKTNGSSPEPLSGFIQFRTQRIAAILGATIIGGIVCVIGVVILIIVGVVFCRRYQCTRRPVEGSSTPESREHPTYSDLTNRENTYLSINGPAESAAMSDSEAHPTYSEITN